MSEPLLKINHLTHRFGGLQALTDINVELTKGEIAGLIGPNGAGKTTVFNLVSGFYVPSEGDIILDGTRINGLKPHKIAELQIGRTFQNIRLWSDMTVLDNICIAQHSKLGYTIKDVFLNSKKFKENEKRIYDSAWELLEKFNLADSALDYPKNLPYGIQRRVEIARCLALEPNFILLDEPFAGVDPIAVADIQQIILHVKNRGIGILITDHNVRETLGIVDKAYILSNGKILLEGTPDEIANDPIAREHYLGDNFKL